jgi:PAS domain S-box-containing protein
MKSQIRGPVGWHPRDIPSPGCICVLSEDSKGEIEISDNTVLPSSSSSRTGPLDTFLPLVVADSLRELIGVIQQPGDSITSQISGGSVENEIRVTLSRLHDKRILVVWGDVISRDDENITDTLHQTASDLPDMISRHDVALEFSSATPSSFPLFGYRPSELNNTSLLSYIHSDDRHMVEAGCLPLLSVPGVTRIRYRLQCSSGEFRWVESAFSSMFRADGSFQVIMASTREMDAIVRAEQAARGANAKLNLLNGIIRHDMMNQITGMIGYLDILSEMVEGEEVQTLIRKEQDIVTRIRRLVDLTRHYQGIGLHMPGFIDVDAVIYKILSRPEFDGKIIGNRFLNGLFVYADRMFEQVFYEMVSNSLVYGGEGVTINFSYINTEEGLIIVMEDSGPGIPNAEKEHIFSRNYQNRRGYGLYLATEILDITGIRIREVGIIGKGARFEIIVPPDGFRLNIT